MYLAILQLSIIIVNYNVRYFLEQCLYSVLNAIREIDAEVIVVDNNSADGSMEWLQPIFPSVRFIANDKNIGFAKANNQALAVCGGEYVLFLNPDTLIPEDCLRKCLSFIKEHPHAGALGVRMLDGKGCFLPESKRAFPLPWISFFKLVGLSSVFSKSHIFNRYALGHLDEHTNHSIEVLAGAFMLVKKEILLQLNGFDESYFLYGEDIDLSYRIKKAGFENIYFAGTNIIHFKGESSGNTDLSRVKYFYEAMLVFVQKQYHSGHAKIFVIFLKMAIALRGLFSAINRLIKPFFLPLADGLLVWLSLHAMRLVWIYEIRNRKEFGVPFIPYALLLFAILFILSAAFTGLYDKKNKTSKTLVSLVFATVSMLAAYSLLPEAIRFSRGVIICGGILGGGMIFLLRKFILSGQNPFFIMDGNDEGQTIVIGNEKEYTEIVQQLEMVANDEQLLGRVSPHDNDYNALCAVKDIGSLEKNFRISRIIFCIGELSLEEIIAQAQLFLKRNIRFLFHASGSRSMVGSQTLTPGAAIITPFIDFRITHSYQQRMKRVVDVILGLFFILTIPFHFLFYPGTGNFIKNTFRVLTGNRTWVGYATEAPSLPEIKKGIISFAGKTQRFAKNVLEKSDKLYARNYDWWEDIVVVFKNYRRLGN